jgi:hypothetical protein
LLDGMVWVGMGREGREEGRKEEVKKVKKAK